MSRSSDVETVGQTLEEYASRGIFRGFSRGPVRGDKCTFKMVWHRDLVFELVFDTKKGTLRIPVVLPNVRGDSEMYGAFKAYLKARLSQELPEHRRIDKAKAGVKCFNRKSNVSLTMTVKDGDYGYGARKLIHFVHEVFMDFLLDGRNYDYMVEHLGLDPDGM